MKKDTRKTAYLPLAALCFCLAACGPKPVVWRPAASPLANAGLPAEQVPPEALPLYGYAIALNAGHTMATNPLVPYNGDGVGTYSAAGPIKHRYPGNELAIKGGEWNGVIRESDLVQDIAERLAHRLTALGASVYMTRIHSSEATFMGRRRNLSARADLANRTKANLFIDLHANYGFGNDRGFMLFVPANTEQMTNFSPGKNFILLDEKKHTPFRDQRLEQSLVFARHIHSAFTEKQNLIPPYKNGTIFLSRFFVIRRVTMPAVLVEFGFMNIQADMNALASAAYRSELADRLTRAVRSYSGK